jgi:hypothetical protein
MANVILREDEDLTLATLRDRVGVAGWSLSALGMTLIRRSAEQLIGAPEAPRVDPDRIRDLRADGRLSSPDDHRSHRHHDLAADHGSPVVADVA